MKTRGKRGKNGPNFNEDHPSIQKQFINHTVGYGVFATQDIASGEFVLQYKGDRIHEEEAEERELSYKKQQHQHCYQYFFTNNVGQTMCIDATNVEDSLGKFVNDAKPQKANCRMKKMVHKDHIILCLFTIKKILAGEELCYDYGISNLPWRKHETLATEKHSLPEISAEDTQETTTPLPEEAQRQLPNMVIPATMLQGDGDVQDLMEVERSSIDGSADIGGKLTLNAENHSLTEISAEDTQETSTPLPEEAQRQLPNMVIPATMLQGDGDVQDLMEVERNSIDGIADIGGKVTLNAENHSLTEISAEDTQETTTPLPEEAQRQLLNMVIPATMLQGDGDVQDLMEVERNSIDGSADIGGKLTLNAENRSLTEISAEDTQETTTPLPEEAQRQLLNMVIPATMLQGDGDVQDLMEVERNIIDGSAGIGGKLTLNAENHSLPEKPIEGTQETTAELPDEEALGHLPDLVVPNVFIQREGNEDFVEVSPIQSGCCDRNLDTVCKEKSNAESFPQQGDAVDKRYKSFVEDELSRVRSMLFSSGAGKVDDKEAVLSDNESNNGEEVDGKEAVLSDNESNNGDQVANDMSDVSIHEADSDYHPECTDSEENDDFEEDDETSLSPQDIPGTSGTSHKKVMDTKMDGGYLDDTSGCEEDHLDERNQGEDSNQDIHVKCSRRKESENGSKRIYDKRNACLYCGKLLQVVIGRHYLSQHKDEVAVAEIVALPVGSRERKIKLDLLRNKGNFFHNEESMQTHSGEIILMRRPPSGTFFDLEDYGPCPQCLGYVTKNDLWRHTKYRCIAKDLQSCGETKRSQIRMESDILMKQYNGANEKLKRIVLASMKRDELFDLLSEDSLILEYGNQVLRNQQSRKHIVSQKMRALASVVLELRKMDPDGGKHLNDFIKPSRFDMIVEAVEKRCAVVENHENGSCQYKFPSFAVKSGHDLVWIARIKRSQAIRQSNAKLEEEANRYLQLHQAEWQVKVSSGAATTLNMRKCQKVVHLPSASDLKKVSQYTQSQIKCLTEKLMGVRPEFRDYRQLQKMTLVRLIVFNKRRPAEMAKLPVASILDRPQWEKCQIDELSRHLNALEKELSKRYQLVKVVGKRGRPVAVIIPPECSDALKVIIEKREFFGIPGCNPYVFARCTSATYLDGGECISDVAASLDLESPETIKSTKMRQYAATVSQVLSLQTQEVEWLASHLGHDVAIHKQYYRLQESTIELCKVSKLLLAMDRGEVAKYSGKTLDEISVEDIPVFEDNSLQDDQDEEEVPHGSPDFSVSEDSNSPEENLEGEAEKVEGEAEKVPSGRPNIPVFEDGGSQDKNKEDEEGEAPDSSPNEKQADSLEGSEKQADSSEGSEKQADSSEGSEKQADSSEGSEKQADSSEGSSNRGRKFCRKRGDYVPWTKAEKKCLFEYFKTNIRQSTVPGRAACREAHNKFACLTERNPDKIKDFIRNHIVRLAKKK